MPSGVEAIRAFEDAGVEMFVGVPDSLMRGFCDALEVWSGRAIHVVAGNEGGAIGTAVGHYLGSGKPAVVYMQNSGLGNAVNPLVSLASRDLYGVPIVLMIGWRGEPGTLDEPQHVHQGRITTHLLELLDVAFEIAGPADDFAELARRSIDKAVATGGPVAILVREGTFDSAGDDSTGDGALRRLDALNSIVAAVPPTTFLVATTGYTARELALVRDRGDQDWGQDFLAVGSMGHASAISLGLAMTAPAHLVCCLDGDGSVAMHLGSMAAIGHAKPLNLLHIVFNNGVHESVGGQSSAIANADLVPLAMSLGYVRAARATTRDELASEIDSACSSLNGPTLLEVVIRPGTVRPLPRPDSFPERMSALMRRVEVVQ